MTEFATLCTEPVGQSYREEHLTAWLAAAKPFACAVDVLAGRSEMPVALGPACARTRPLGTRRGLHKPTLAFEEKALVAGGLEMWQAAAHRGLATISTSHFADGWPQLNQAFYSRPPVAYSLCSAGVFVVVCFVELVGRLFITPISQPHVVGSSELQAVIDSLSDDPFTARRLTAATASTTTDSASTTAGTATAAGGASADAF